MIIKKMLLGLVFGLSFLTTQAAIKEPTPLPGFKKVWIYGNTVNPSSVVIILSGDGGWVLGVVDVARHLAKKNAMVIGVSCMPYIKHLQKQNVECYSVATNIENLSIFIQKKYGVSNYIKPIILGYSLGATLAYGMIAQAPAGTFKGAISVGFCYDLEMPKPLCKGVGLECSKRPKKGYDLLPVTHIRDPFIIIQGANDRMCKYCLAKDFASQTTNAELIEMPNLRHGSLGLKKWIPKIMKAYEKILGTN
jgi:type IV secretory pathway VirJ component